MGSGGLEASGISFVIRSWVVVGDSRGGSDYPLLEATRRSGLPSDIVSPIWCRSHSFHAPVPHGEHPRSHLPTTA